MGGEDELGIIIIPNKHSGSKCCCCSKPVLVVAASSICAFVSVFILVGVASAARAYDPSSGDRRTLLIVGGRPSHLSTSSLLQLHNFSEPFCSPTALSSSSSFPFPVSGIRIAESGGRPIVCGGLDEGNFLGKRLSSCHVFSAFWGSWSRMPSAELEYPREAYGLVQLNEQDFMIAGGFSSGGETLGSTEIFRGASGSFSAGPDLPENLKLSGSCWAKVNETHFMLTGGSRGSSSNGGFSKEVFLFDYPHNYWSRLPSLSVQRSEHGCGLVRHQHKRKRKKRSDQILRRSETEDKEEEEEEETEFVVVGGVREASTEIFSFKTMRWRKGLAWHSELSYSASVPFGDTFLVVGGVCQAECVDRQVKEEDPPEEEVPPSRNYPVTKLLVYDPVREGLVQREELLLRGGNQEEDGEGGLYLAGALLVDKGLFGCDRG